jgi:hypothetical protein
VTLYTEGFSRFVTSTTAPIATGWSDSCRVGLSPTERSRLCTAHLKAGSVRLVADLGVTAFTAPRPRRTHCPASWAVARHARKFNVPQSKRETGRHQYAVPHPMPPKGVGFPDPLSGTLKRGAHLSVLRSAVKITYQQLLKIGSRSGPLPSPVGADHEIRIRCEVEAGKPTMPF